MKLKKETTNNIPFSLHDSRIRKIEIKGDHLHLYLDQVYEYTEDSEKFYPATLTFTNIDLEECHVLVFDSTLENGAFSGVAYQMNDFIDLYSDAEFEIITETYGMNTTFLEGLIFRKGHDPVSAIMSIWTLGDILFDF